MIKWLTCTKELKNLGFSITEIKTALKQSGLGIRDLTDNEDYEHEPSYTLHEVVSEPFTKALERTVKERYDRATGGVLVCKSHYNGTVTTYRVSATYQGLKHETVIRRLLNNRFEWFKSFKWSIYEMHGEGRNYEIYLETKAGSVYVPVKALLKADPKIIEARMLDYHNDYRSQRDPKQKRHNHKKNEHQQTNGGCGLCQEVFFQKSMKPLKSGTYKRLKEMMQK